MCFSSSHAKVFKPRVKIVGAPDIQIKFWGILLTSCMENTPMYIIIIIILQYISLLTASSACSDINNLFNNIFITHIYMHTQTVRTQKYINIYIKSEKYEKKEEKDTHYLKHSQKI